MRVTFFYLSILLLSLVWNGSAHAYEEDTHAELSVRAARQSVMGLSEVLKDLGLAYSIDDPQQKFNNSKGTAQTISDLFQDGARFEDGFTPCSTRPKHHFFDPTSGENRESARTMEAIQTLRELTTT